MQQNGSIGKIRDDLREDAGLFQYLVKDLVKKSRNPPYGKQQGVSTVITFVSDVAARVDAFGASVHALGSSVQISSLYKEKQAIIHDIHTASGIVGSVFVASHWQSPAIDQSVVDQAGTLKGNILAHFNDYTRDQHAIGEIFEKQYRRAYVPLPIIIPVYTYATSSGMAALTTAALMIMGETQKDTPIFMGESCYFETKQLLLSLFGRRIVSVDLADTHSVAEAVLKHKPVALFADTIGNEPAMRVADIPALLSLMKSSEHSQTYVVADTSASSFARPLINGLRLPSGVMLIGVESQNKFLQYGLDRVTAGVVWGTGFAAMKLYDYRDHAGTICPDASIAALPTPNRVMAARYVRRLGRNAALMAHLLAGSDKIKRLGVTVRYPESAGFCGAYLMLSWKENPLRTFDGYIKKVMGAAQRRGIPLVHGTSFGFHTTRVYTVAMHTQYGKPFLRISPGTETEQEIHELARLLIDML